MHTVWSFWFLKMFALNFLHLCLSVTGRGSTKGAGLSSLVSLIRNRIKTLFMSSLHLGHSCGDGLKLWPYDCYFDSDLNFSAECKWLLLLKTTKLWPAISCITIYGTNYEAACHALICHRSSFTSPIFMLNGNEWAIIWSTICCLIVCGICQFTTKSHKWKAPI